VTVTSRGADPTQPVRELTDEQIRDLCRFGYMIKHFEVDIEKHRHEQQDALSQVERFDELDARGELTDQMRQLRTAQTERADREHGLEREAIRKRQQVMNRLLDGFGIDSLHD
jgi:hypothetical protein